jgi:hypothetical protein
VQYHDTVGRSIVIILQRTRLITEIRLPRRAEDMQVDHGDPTAEVSVMPMADQAVVGVDHVCDIQVGCNVVRQVQLSHEWFILKN